MAQNRKIIYKTLQQINNIRESGKYLTEILQLLYSKIEPWTVLLELEVFVEKYLQKNKIKWAFKGYNWYPANLCLSINDCVVHGIPDEYVLKNWDVLKIDCGVTYRAGISDSAITVIVGGEMANPEGFALMQATKEALDLWLEKLKPYKKLFDYSQIVYDHIKKNNFEVIQNLTWHGVGVMVHEAPHIYNYPHSEMRKVTLKPNMVIALEPITAITSKVTVEKPWNSWNLYTKWWDIGAQWEYTLVITDEWYEILSGVVEDLW